ETAGGDEKGVPIHRWQTMPSCERDNEVAMRIGGAVSYHDHSSFRYVARERSNSLFNIGGIILDRDEYRLDPDRRPRQLGALQIDLVIRSRFGISHEGNVCNLRLNLLEHAQVFATDTRLVHGQAREIAFGARQAMNEALCNCVSDANEHDWDRAGLALK